MSLYPCNRMGGRDIRYEFADFAVYSSRLCFFITTKSMVNNINNFGVINFYENKPSKQEPSRKAEPVCEDVTPVSPSVSPESHSGSTKLFPRITKAAYDAGKAESVDDELRSASVSAPKLVKTIRTNEALGYLDTKNMTLISLLNYFFLYCYNFYFYFNIY